MQSHDKEIFAERACLCASVVTSKAYLRDKSSNEGVFETEIHTLQGRTFDEMRAEAYECVIISKYDWRIF